MNLKKNVEQKEGFNQVCVWPGCILDKKTGKEFEQFMKKEFRTRIQFLEEIETGPDKQGDEIVAKTGGRHDLFFAVFKDDIGAFAVPRLIAGIRWIEDVLAIGNYRSPIYPKRVFQYCIWNKDHLATD
jgi:hypothetical protein